MQDSIEHNPFADASLDVVIAVTVLCFAADASGAVHDMGRVPRPGGRLVLGERGMRSHRAMTLHECGWLGAATWKATRFRTAGELRTIAKSARLSVTVIRGAAFVAPQVVAAGHSRVRQSSTAGS